MLNIIFKSKPEYYPVYLFQLMLFFKILNLFVDFVVFINHF